MPMVRNGPLRRHPDIELLAGCTTLLVRLMSKGEGLAQEDLMNQ